MLLFNNAKPIILKPWTQISIHPMLLFNKCSCIIRSTFYFNTSHVVIQLLRTAFEKVITFISIHHMLLFNIAYITHLLYYNVVSIHPILLFNGSNQYGKAFILDTSIHPMLLFNYSVAFPCQFYSQFQYILCYYSTCPKL